MVGGCEGEWHHQGRVREHRALLLEWQKNALYLLQVCDAGSAELAYLLLLGSRDNCRVSICFSHLLLREYLTKSGLLYSEIHCSIYVKTMLPMGYSEQAVSKAGTLRQTHP